MKPNELTTTLKRSFESLKKLFDEYLDDIDVVLNQPESYYLNYISDDEYNLSEPQFCGAVQIRRDYVYLYIGALTRYPELLCKLPRSLYQYMNPGGNFSFKKTTPLIIEDLRQLLHMCIKADNVPVTSLAS
jgi:hypothetical protein